MCAACLLSKLNVSCKHLVRLSLLSVLLIRALREFTRDGHLLSFHEVVPTRLSKFLPARHGDKVCLLLLAPAVVNRPEAIPMFIWIPPLQAFLFADCISRVT